MTENQEEDKSNKTFLWWFLRVVGILIISAVVVALITFLLKRKSDWMWRKSLYDPTKLLAEQMTWDTLGKKPFLAWILLSVVMIGILYGTNN